ncbi:hypothetical protein EDE12_101930 [Methylosinus sp. sav-2]|uniref:hypothetical protein n=1 Tax=Methylosinus sp. sav-2 TaxID=2485168 RepID=UPI00047AEA15|nr:hypothetical protein [Methylosinus sp. sav-2]TDX67385.1 hypothetical protein EDE12_101930 [Methylosinus sp. sav-2]
MTATTLLAKDEASARTRAPLRNLLLLQLGVLVFLLSNAALAFGFRAIAATPILAGCALAAFLLFSFRPKQNGLLAAPIDTKTLTACLALAVALLLLGGETHLFYANLDWLVRDAVLSDLTRQGFPLFYRYEGQDYLLRAPLGMYLIPATIGHYAGLVGAHIAMLAQNALLLGLCLYFIAKLAGARAAPFLALFILFSGLDILPQLLHEGLELPDHLEWWNSSIQYSSHVTQLFWVPNHALPGWWAALLLLLLAREEIDLALLAILFAASLLWSPLAAVGAAPLIGFCALRLRHALFSWRNIAAAAAGLCFLPIALYLTVDAESVKHGWLAATPGFALLYLAFILVEIPQAAILLAARDAIAKSDRALIGASVVVLLALPFYYFGPNNDLAMRASMPALFLLAFAFAGVAVSTPRDGGRLASLISAIVIVAAATPAMEIKRALVSPAFAISDCDLLTSWRKTDPSIFPTNYLARLEKLPAWLGAASEARLEIERRSCWPAHPHLPDSRK